MSDIFFCGDLSGVVEVDEKDSLHWLISGMTTRLFACPSSSTLNERLVESIKGGDEHSVEHSLSKGADANYFASAEVSCLPLQLAVVLNNVVITKMLLEHHALVDAADGVGRTALHYAAERSSILLEILLAHKANPNMKDKGGATPLHWAAYKGKTDCARLLLERGALVNTTTVLGETSLFWAVRKSHLSTVQLLLEYNADCQIPSIKNGLPINLTLGFFYVGFDSPDDLKILELLMESMGSLAYLSYQATNLARAQSDEVIDNLPWVTPEKSSRQYWQSTFTALPLMQMCRYVIRKACGDAHLPNVICKLPISNKLQKYILLQAV